MPDRIGLAVSGGGDSAALMHLAAERLPDVRLEVATVDHGLREGSAGEAAAAGRQAAALGLEHAVLSWPDPPRSGIQAAARDARRRLLGDWAVSRRLSLVLTGHTIEDQAETVLMRLARGGGPAALAGIRRRSYPFGRPLLDARRSDLRDWLSGRGLTWIEDPSNEDPIFERARWRAALPEIERMGLGVRALALTAARMEGADVGIEAAVDALDDGCGRGLHGAIRLADLGHLADMHGTEVAARLLARIVRRVGVGRPPRRAELERLLPHLSKAGPGMRRTMGGCLFAFDARGLTVQTEPAALRGLSAPLEAAGDGTSHRAVWRDWLEIDGPEGARVAALGEAGAREVPRRVPLPHLLYVTLPALWRDGRLLAFHPQLHVEGAADPAQGHGPSYRIRLLPDGRWRGPAPATGSPLIRTPRAPI